MKNDPPLMIDLFAGAGGLSLGFKNAGFKVICAIEIDDWACDTYEKNHVGVKVIRKDISQIPDGFFLKFKNISVIAGGPPCQGFSIAASNRRKKNDKRNSLYKEFLRVVKLVQPKVVLIENVKELEKFKNEHGKKILDDIYETLSVQGYSVKHYLLNAKDFGVPQNRTRFFLIAAKHALPELTSKKKNFKHLTLWQAISDLPEVKPWEHNENDVFNYNCEPNNLYQKMMRTGTKKVYNHISMRHTERLIKRFEHIRLIQNNNCVGGDFAPRKRGNPDAVSNKHYSQNHRRLIPDEPSPTITASFYSSFIHPYQNRNLTVREASRLQSFPDTYVFCGKRTTLSKKLLAKKGIHEDIHLDQFSQVGNAVPPLLAEYLAKKIMHSFGVQ